MPKSHVLPMDASRFQDNILAWYQENQRVLPWRARGDMVLSPYWVWLSEIMLQQTTVPAVIPYFLKFTEKWPDIGALAAADDGDVMAAWAGLGYYARARNLLKCARVVSRELGGVFPDNVTDLEKLPGIGPYTAAAIASIAFGCGDAVVVDGNIERIVSRLFTVSESLPKGKKVIRDFAARIFDGIFCKGGQAVSAFPQALMDIGADICLPKNPKCSACPVKDFCLARAEGVPESYPVKAAKKELPTRYGKVYWIQDRVSGHILFETRDKHRMLGGMRGLPTTDWDLKEKGGQFSDPVGFLGDMAGDLQKIGVVVHVFTHFRLVLEIWGAVVDGDRIMLESNQSFVKGNLGKDDEKRMGLPTVFLKVGKIANGYFQSGEK